MDLPHVPASRALAVRPGAVTAGERRTSCRSLTVVGRGAARWPTQWKGECGQIAPSSSRRASCSCTGGSVAEVRTCGCVGPGIRLAGGRVQWYDARRTLSMRPEVDRMLVAHVERTPGATLSSTVNAALVEYLEAAALEGYRQWDAQADPDERAALDAFAVHDDASWASV